MKKVTDTSKIDPALILAEMMGAGGSSQAIQAQESRGQREAVNSDQLPTKGLLGADWPIYEAMGIKIVEKAPGTTASKDLLFCEVDLPKGWKKAATDHAMWNNLIDDKGRIRATFFYKAAFYDRDAFIRPCRRFSIERDFARADYRNVFDYQVKDGKKVLFSITKPVTRKPNGDEDYSVTEQDEKNLRTACAQWLRDNGFPNYDDFNAYWD